MTKTIKYYIWLQREKQKLPHEKRRGKREWMERMNSRVWFIKSDRMFELKKIIKI